MRAWRACPRQSPMALSVRVVGEWLCSSYARAVQRVHTLSSVVEAMSDTSNTVSDAPPPQWRSPGDRESQPASSSEAMRGQDERKGSSAASVRSAAFQQTRFRTTAHVHVSQSVNNKRAPFQCIQCMWILRGCGGITHRIRTG